jgi:hypothetical protein
MTIREIVTLPEPILRQKARKVNDFGPDLQTLVEDMIETMRQAPGVGLAAPQVGEPSRLIVEYGDEEKVPPKLYVMVSEIAYLSGRCWYPGHLSSGIQGRGAPGRLTVKVEPLWSPNDCQAKASGAIFQRD